MSKYILNKFLYRTDRDPAQLAAYKADPAAFVEQWVAGDGGNLSNVERTSWITLTDEEKEALVNRDYARLYELGAHWFLTLTFYIAVYEDEYPDFFTFAADYAEKVSGLGYPDFAT